MTKAKVQTDSGFLFGNQEEIKTLGAPYVAVYRSLSPADKAKILADTESILDAYDPQAATPKDNAILGGILIGVSIGKGLLD